MCVMISTFGSTFRLKRYCISPPRSCKVPVRLMFVLVCNVYCNKWPMRVAKSCFSNTTANVAVIASLRQGVEFYVLMSLIRCKLIVAIEDDAKPQNASLCRGGTKYKGRFVNIASHFQSAQLLCANWSRLNVRVNSIA